jgi:hypothetical protein
MTLLPDGFEKLADLLPIWALPTENARSEKRWRSTPRDFQSFYDAMMPELPRILDLLSRYPLAGAPAEVESLYRLTMAFAEVAPHTEMYGNSAKVPNSFEAARFVAAHGERAE